MVLFLLALLAQAASPLVFLDSADPATHAVWASHGDRDVDLEAQARFDAHLKARGEAVRGCLQRLLDARPDAEQVEAALLLRAGAKGKATATDVYPKERNGGLPVCLDRALGGPIAGQAAPGFVGYRLTYARAVDRKVREARPLTARSFVGIGKGTGLGGGGMGFGGMGSSERFDISWTSEDVGNADWLSHGLRRVQGALRKCLRPVDRAHADVRLEVSADGKAKPKAPSVPPPVRDCLEDALRGAQFPPSAAPWKSRFRIAWKRG